MKSPRHRHPGRAIGDPISPGMDDARAAAAAEDAPCRSVTERGWREPSGAHRQALWSSRARTLISPAWTSPAAWKFSARRKLEAESVSQETKTQVAPLRLARVRGAGGRPRARGRARARPERRGGAQPAPVAWPQPARRGQEGVRLPGVPAPVPRLHADHPAGRGRDQPGRHRGCRHLGGPGRADGVQRGDRPAPGGQGRGERQGAGPDDEDHRPGPAGRPGDRDRRRGAGAGRRGADGGGQPGPGRRPDLRGRDPGDRGGRPDRGEPAGRPRAPTRSRATRWPWATGPAWPT